MDFNEITFERYDNIDINKLESISKAIRESEKTDLLRIATHKFATYFDAETSEAFACSQLETKSLLGVPDSVAVINTTHSSPYYSDYSVIGGWANIITEPFLFPIIFIFPRHNENIYEHEVIHILQYLHKNAPPMSKMQQSVFHEMNFREGIKYFLEKDGVDSAIDFLINANCYQFWTELEAYYFSMPNNDYNDFMMSVYRSAMPIERFTDAFAEFNFDGKYMDQVRSSFSYYCGQIEQQVDWVKTLVENSIESSFYDMVYWTHDDYESDCMFGPLEDDEYDDELANMYNEIDDIYE